MEERDSPKVTRVTKALGRTGRGGNVRSYAGLVATSV
jgi:hypothetical protein